MSLFIATGLGFWIFTSPGPTAIGWHALFLITIIVFLVGLLQGIRSRVEVWVREQSTEQFMMKDSRTNDQPSVRDRARDQ